jgi:hypothetical protein
MSDFDEARWKRECDEWDKTLQEMLARKESPSAYDVTLALQKKLWARGERLMTLEELGVNRPAGPALLDTVPSGMGSVRQLHPPEKDK